MSAFIIEILQNFESESAGIIPRCLLEFFKKPQADENLPACVEQTEFAASFIEIYNEKAYDLLADNCTEPIVARGKQLFVFLYWFF